MLIGGARADRGGELSGGYYVQPTVFEGDNSMRIFQEEIFGPVVSVTRFSDEADALKIANDTLYGLGAACGRGTNTMMLEHYQQTKNLLVSYSPDALGFF